MKISEDKLKEGRELAKKHGFKELFVNEKGEFFTSKSFASMSVDYDKDKFAEVDLSEDGSQKTEVKATNDLEKAVDVIANIEAATEATIVEAILKAETEGKNRPTVVKAAAKKLAGFEEALKLFKVTEDSKVIEDSKDSTKVDETVINKAE